MGDTPLLPALVITGRSWRAFEEQARASHAFVREKPIEPEDLRRFARYACTLRSQGRPFVERMIRELAVWAGLTSREVTFVEVLVLGGEPVDDPEREIEAGVLSKTGKASTGAVRAAVLVAFFEQERPFG